VRGIRDVFPLVLLSSVFERLYPQLFSFSRISLLHLHHDARADSMDGREIISSDDVGRKTNREFKSTQNNQLEGNHSFCATNDNTTGSAQVFPVKMTWNLSLVYNNVSFVDVTTGTKTARVSDHLVQHKSASLTTFVLLLKMFSALVLEGLYDPVVAGALPILYRKRKKGECLIIGLSGCRFSSRLYSSF